MMSRRQFGLSAAATPVAALVGGAAPPPQSQQQIARRIHALAKEMSLLLGDLDDGSWQMRVSPPFRGEPMVHIEPVRVSAEARLQRGIHETRAALAALHPGSWRVEHSAENAFLIFIDDAWHEKTRAHGVVNGSNV